MRFAPWISLVAAAVVASPLVSAQTLQTPSASESSADRPKRGMTMEKVEAKFGAPSNRAPSVGQPPITRWEYPGFVVYFEHSIVLHTVVTG
jgi:hypothetical protein